MGSLHQKVSNCITIDLFITIVLDSNLEITIWFWIWQSFYWSEKLTEKSKEMEEDGFLHCTATCAKYLP